MPKYHPDPLRSRSDAVTERFVDFDGGFHIVTEQDCSATINAVRAASDIIPRKTKADGARYAGSVPVVKAHEWAKECGFPVGSHGWVDYATKKLNSSEYKHLRANLK